MIQLCRHILPGGKICDQASVRGTLYCRHHSTVKAAIEREHAAPDPELVHTPLALVYPEDRAAIQLNLFLVLEALNHKRIDVRTANAMNRLLRACEQNLRTGTLAETSRDKVAQQVITLPNGDEIGMPREALEASDRPENQASLGCPCQECVDKAAALPREHHHAQCRCGACVPVETATGRQMREATQSDLHCVPPEPYDWANAPAWMTQGPQASQSQDSQFQDMLLEQYQQQAREPMAQNQQKQVQQRIARQMQAQPAQIHQRPAQQRQVQEISDQQARDQYERDQAIMEALAAEYELRTGSDVEWKKGMKEALLADFKQARAEGRLYQPRDLAASGA